MLCANLAFVGSLSIGFWRPKDVHCQSIRCGESRGIR